MSHPYNIFGFSARDVATLQRWCETSPNFKADARNGFCHYVGRTMRDRAHQAVLEATVDAIVMKLTSLRPNLVGQALVDLRTVQPIPGGEFDQVSSPVAYARNCVAAYMRFPGDNQTLLDVIKVIEENLTPNESGEWR